MSSKTYAFSCKCGLLRRNKARKNMNIVVSKQDFMYVLRYIQVCQHGRCRCVTPISILPLPKLQRLPVRRAVVLGPDQCSLPHSCHWEDDPCPAEQTGCMLLPIPHRILIDDVARVIFTLILKVHRVHSSLLSAVFLPTLFWGPCLYRKSSVCCKGWRHRCICTLPELPKCYPAGAAVLCQDSGCFTLVWEPVSRCDQSLLRVNLRGEEWHFLHRDRSNMEENHVTGEIFCGIHCICWHCTGPK